MTNYKGIDFDLARRTAYNAVSRLFTVRGTPTDAAWTVELEINTPPEAVVVEVRLILTPDFPLSLPFVFLSKPDIDRLRFPPNVDTEGQVCTYDRGSVVADPEDPESLVLDCLIKARRILEAGVSTPAIGAYDEEFIAYWECNYPGEPAVDTHVVSLHPDTDPIGSPPIYVELSQTIGGYTSLIYSSKDQFEPLREFLQRRRIRFSEVPTFYAGELNELSPPFTLNAAAESSLMAKLGFAKAHKRYLSRQPLPVVTFTRKIRGRQILLGWRHDSSRRRGKPGRKHRKSGTQGRASAPLNRFSPDVLSFDRLRQRSAADFPEPRPFAGASVLVAGLGSVGSALIPFLEAANFEQFLLVDPDNLELDNVKRHLLGFSAVGTAKTDAIHDYLLDRNPLLRVNTRKKSLVEVARGDPEFLASASYHFFCTGDTNSEMWIANAMQSSSWRRPSFFIWLEPYLAGGHCIYCTPRGTLEWDSLFPDDRFHFNVISEEEYLARDFSKREAGCQVSFIPYSGASARRFVSSLFPAIHNILRQDTESIRITWVGDKGFLKSAGIRVSPLYEDIPPFTLVQSSL